MKKPDFVTIPYEDYLRLMRDSLRGIAAHNALNKAGNPRETMVAAEQDLVNLWRKHDSTIQDFDSLVDYHITTALSVYKEKQIKLENM